MRNNPYNTLGTYVKKELKMDIYSITNEKGEFLSKDEINEMLGKIGISDQAIESGDQDAIEADAKQNNIDLNRLQTIAKTPENELNGSADTAKQDYERELKTRGIPNDIIAQGQAAIQAYADKMNIRLPENSGTTLNLQF